jgi:hypothetical protein
MYLLLVVNIGGTINMPEKRPMFVSSAFWIGQIQASVEETREILSHGLKGTASFSIFDNDSNKDIRSVVIVSRQLSEDTLKSIVKQKITTDLMKWNGSNDVAQTQPLPKQTETLSSRKVRTIGGCLRRYCFFVDFFKKNTACVQLNSHELSTLISGAIKCNNANMLEDLITQIFAGMTLLEPAMHKRCKCIGQKLLLIEHHMANMERIATQPNVDTYSILLYKNVIQEYVDKIRTSWDTIQYQLSWQDNKSDCTSSEYRLQNYKTNAITIALLCALQTSMEKWEQALQMTNWETNQWILLDELLSKILKEQAIASHCVERLISHITKEPGV